MPPKRHAILSASFLTAGSAVHHQQGSAKPMRMKTVTMLQKAPMPTLFVSTSSAKHLA